MSTGSHQGSQYLGKYELRERLGRGGMAEVWKAFDPQLERYIAIKLLHADLQNDPEFMTRFAREARVIASLHHPNIVQIHDFQISDSSESNNPLAYMVMDYVEGGTLADYIRYTARARKFPPAEDIMHLFTSIGKAIDYAHQQGMVHRDIKPSNILLDKRALKASPDAQYQIGEPILSDFGIVKLLTSSSSTLNRWWLGTPSYMAPEQAMGYPGNELSDIYSLGVILYEICTGQRPFQGENTDSMMMQHISTMPPPPVLINRSIPLALSAVILHGLAKDPAARFPSASSMAAALAEALTSPSSVDVSQTYVVGRPATFTPSEPNLAPTIIPSSPSLPIAGASSPTPPAVLSTPVFSAPSSDRQTLPTTPVSHSAGTPSGIYPVQNPPAFASTQSPPVLAFPPTAPSQKGKRLKGWYIVLLATLMITLIGAGFGVFFVLSHRSPATAVAPTQIVGHAFFVSSGQVNEHSSQGINDEFEIDLQNIPDPAPGKSYYAWLEPDKGMNMAAPILLGALPVHQGQVHYLYPGDQQHTNLLEITSRFLITEENTNVLPTIPSPDISAWRYSAEFPPPSANAMDMSNMSDLSVLDHLRHLLAEAPELKQVGLSGGLDIWLFRNTQKVLEWAGSARDDWQSKDTSFMHRQFVRILDYLDGLSFVQTDAPGEPVLVDSQPAQIALLDLSQHRFPSYLYQIDVHLNALLQSPNVTPGQRILSARIDVAIKDTIVWLEQVHRDTVQLVKMSNTQLLQSSTLSILDDMVTQALYAFVGRIDPATGQLQEGVVQVHYDIQRLATFDIKPYQS
jgi:serine/threonine protein kinase